MTFEHIKMQEIADLSQKNVNLNNQNSETQ